jgi:uncharacterized protein (DUF342 family)
MSTTDCPAQAKVEISSDRLTVTLGADPSLKQGITPANLLAQLHEMGIELAEPDSIEALAGADGQIRSAEEIVLFQGTPPIAEQPAKLELLVKPPDPEATSSYYERTSYLNAVPDQAIAKILPAIPGTDGIDVFGHPIVDPKPQSAIPTLGNNVKLDDDELTVRSTAVGRICQKAGIFWVETAKEVPGDVDFACENIEVAGDIHIHGSVLDLFKVKGSNIHVGGAVEAAEITAAHDLHVGGGIIGKDKGRCTAGGDITCKYITNATLTADGNILSHGDIAHARLVCGGRLTVERGPLTSGHVTANGGVSCRSLGSYTGTPVLVEVGFDDKFRSTAKAALHDILAWKKTAQHQRAAGQMHDAAESERTADELLGHLRDAFTASHKTSVPEILVQDILHAGVMVRFPGISATIECDWKGPLRMIPRQHDNEWQLNLIDLRTKSTHTLPSHPWHDAAFDVLQKTTN